MRTVIFDLDGTLADTSGDLIAAANHCFRHMWLGDLLDPGLDAGVALRGGRSMLTHGLTKVALFDAATVDVYYPMLLDAYSGAIDVHTFVGCDAMSDVVSITAKRTTAASSPPIDARCRKVR